MVATPLGPNQAMNAFVAVSTRSHQSGEDGGGPRDQEREGDDANRRHTVVNSPPNVSRDPNTTNIPSLTQLDDVLRARFEALADVGAQEMPSTIAHTKTGDEAVAFGL